MSTTTLTKRAAKAAAKPAKPREECRHCKRSIAVIGKAGQLARHSCVDGPDMTPVERVRNARYITGNATRSAEYRTWQVQSAVRTLLVLHWIVGPIAAIFTLIAAGAYLFGGDATIPAFLAALLIVGGGYGDNVMRTELRERRAAQRRAIARQHGSLSVLELVEAVVDPSVAYPELYPAVKVPRPRRATR